MDAKLAIRPRPTNFLTPRMRRFIAEYLKHGNGTRAAVRAGYSPRTARVQASQMLSNVKVARVVQLALGQIAKANQALVTPKVGELVSLALLDPADLYDQSGRLLPISKMAPQVRAAIAHLGACSPAQRERLIERACLRAKLDALTTLAVYGGPRTTAAARSTWLPVGSTQLPARPPTSASRAPATLRAQIGGILLRQ